MFNSTKLLKISIIIIASLVLAMCFFIAFLSIPVYADTTYTLTVVNYDDLTQPIDTLNDKTTVALADLEVNHLPGYTYTYYQYLDEDGGKAGDEITFPLELIENTKIVQKKEQTIYHVNVYENSAEATPTILDFYYDVNIQSDVKDLEESGKYYIYLIGGVESDLDIEIENDIDVIRLDAFDVSLYLRENNVDSLIEHKILPKTAYYDLAAFSEDTRYEYKYYFFDLFENEIGEPVSQLYTELNSNPCQYNEQIKFIQTKKLLKFTLSNNMNDETKEVIYSTSYGTLFDDPEKTGYKFLDWTFNNNPIKEDSVVNVKADHKLIARFAPLPYVLTIDPQNGGNIEKRQVTFDQPIDIKTPEREGYTFLGWKYNNDSFIPSEPYKYPHNITIKANWVAKQYNVTYSVLDQNIELNITYDDENVSLSSSALETFKENNIVFGFTYTKANGDKELFVGSSLTIPKWNKLQNYNLEVVSMPILTEYDSSLSLPNTYSSDFKLYFNDNLMTEEYSTNEIGYHTIKIINASDEVVYEKQILIKENIGVENEVVYDNPIYLNSLNATILVDNNEINPLDYRIDKAGTHTITVLGAGGYTNTYVVTYNNNSLIRAWIIFGIAMAIAVGALVLAIFGRRKVVSYDTDRE